MTATVKPQDFSIGDKFMFSENEYMVTDIGTRVIVAIQVREDWMNGPPYALHEGVFDEYDMEGIEL